MMNLSKHLLVLSLIAFVFVGCSNDMNTSNPVSALENTTTSDLSKKPDFAKKPGDTIVDLAIASAPEFTTLVQAVVKADLVATLDGNRMFTVFAPTNAAFDAAAVAVLGAGNTGMDLVNALDVPTLTNILLYHVSPGERFSSDVLSAERIRMMNKSFTFVDDTNLTIVGNNSSANLILSLVDIDASNGVIHGIDFVLLP
jgi:transforming growth factor-beta-induced protein